MSTEETQLLADLKAEGERLGSLESRYAVLESFDRGATQPINRQPIIPQAAKADENAPESWIDPATGRSIRVLGPKDRMSSIVAPTASEPLSLGKYMRGIVTGKWENAGAERLAMSEGTLGSGGYLLPAPLSAQVIDRARNLSVVVRAGAITVPMESSTLAMARVTADPTAGWHSENGVISTSEPTFDRVNFAAQTLACLASTSAELWDDAANLDTVLLNVIAKVMALELDRASLTGTGTAPQPKGIRNQTGVVIDSTTFGTNGAAISTTTPTGAVAWDWLSKQIGALWTVNENPNAVIYAPRTAQELDLLRASTGVALPPPGSVAALQRLFSNQVPINLTQGTSNAASDAYVGDFSLAMIGMRQQIQIEISRTANVGSTSLFSTYGIGIRAILRADFQLARPAAFRVCSGIL